MPEGSNTIHPSARTTDFLVKSQIEGFCGTSIWNKHLCILIRQTLIGTLKKKLRILFFTVSWGLLTVIRNNIKISSMCRQRREIGGFILQTSQFTFQFSLPPVHCKGSTHSTLTLQHSTTHYNTLHNVQTVNTLNCIL